MFNEYKPFTKNYRRFEYKLNKSPIMNKISKYLNLSYIAILGVVAAGCWERHEVIPPPEKIVEFDCELTAVISDTIPINYRCGVEDMEATTDSPKTFDPSGFNTARYRVTFYHSSDQNPTEFVMNRGYLKWSGNNTVPSIEEFEGYFAQGIQIPYSMVVQDATDGVQIKWIEGNGSKWESADSTASDEFMFTTLSQESDTLDYMLFTAEFNCRLWRETDSAYRDITDGVLKYRFIRD